jgi:hypothetical protein
MRQRRRYAIADRISYFTTHLVSLVAVLHLFAWGLSRIVVMGLPKPDYYAFESAKT